VSTQYNLDGAGFVPYAGAVTLADGPHTLVYRSIDAQGNQTQDTPAAPFTVDSTAPVTTATVAGGTPIAGGYVQVPAKAVVALAAVDALSPVAGIEYAVDGGAFQAYAAPFTVNGNGLHVVRYRATDALGNVEAARTLNLIIDPTADGTVSGSVAATLSLSLGAPASFGNFTAGVGHDYAATTTATVTSSAGAAVLSVADPSANATGRLVNGTFALAQPLQFKASSAGGTGSAFAPLGASPLTLLTYTGPKSNDAVTIDLQQTIGANEPLRTGSYAKTLTFTLSTTTP